MTKRKNYKSSFIKAVFKVQLTVGIDSVWIQSSLENQPLERPQFSTFVPHTFNVFSWTFSNVYQSLIFFFFFYSEHPYIHYEFLLLAFYYIAYHKLIPLFIHQSKLFFKYFRVTCNISTLTSKYFKMHISNKCSIF